MPHMAVLDSAAAPKTNQDRAKTLVYSKKHQNSTPICGRATFVCTPVIPHKSHTAGWDNCGVANWLPENK